MPDTYPQLFLAYSAIWLLIVLFCIFLSLRQRATERKLEQLEGRLAAQMKNGRS